MKRCHLVMVLFFAVVGVSSRSGRSRSALLAGFPDGGRDVGFALGARFAVSVPV